jgi:hypothetical protein
MDEETELLIEHLTTQLQTEKARNRELGLSCKRL